MSKPIAILLLLAISIGLAGMAVACSCGEDPQPRLPRDNLLVYRGPDGKPAPVKTIADWAIRRAEVVRGMEAVMGKLPGEAKRCPLDVKIEEEVDGGTYLRRLITYASEPGSRVPAYLLIPKAVLDGKKKAPAILCLHGTNNVIGHGIVVGLGNAPNRAYALELAERGHVTLAPNYPLLAKYQPDLKKLGWESGTLKAVWDNIRGLDLLESLPFVDSSRGFGTIGHSLGGHNSVYTAVFDERLKVVVSSCGLDAYVDYFNGDPKNWDPERGWCQIRYMRKLADYKGRLAEIPFDFHEMIGGLAPRHVFIVAPTKDSNFRADSVDRIAAAALPIFKLHGRENRLRVEHPVCEHDFPSEMREEAYKLFDKVLVTAEKPGKPRLLVLTDIGGDPDDQQSMIRLMTYANEFEIEGLIASAGGTPMELKADIIHPELIREIVEAYGKVQPNLLLHRPDYPQVGRLLERIKSGNPRRGIKNIGKEHDTEGSRWIAAMADRDDPRPLNITIWGGSTELAQALWRARNDRTPDELKRFLGKLRIFAIGHQDDTGPWILEHFPDLFYILSMAPEKRDKREGAYRGMYLDGDESLTSRAWVDLHVRTKHGPLGALYPTNTWTAPNPHACLKEGDTPSWLYFLPTGLSDPEYPDMGSWGGRFRSVGRGLFRDAADTVGSITDARATVWRWRPAFQADFAARMDWCVKPAQTANHPPVAVLNGDKSDRILELKALPGETVKLSAAGSSDPDGNKLVFRWFNYREAGTVAGDTPLSDSTSETATVVLPSDVAGKAIHIVLEVTDTGKPALTRYRRAILHVDRVEACDELNR